MSDQTKLWIGNIDAKLSEYQLLKICEAFGKINAFNFLYTMNTKSNGSASNHRVMSSAKVGSGGHRVPRGYAFVTYESSDAAKNAIQQLDKKKLNGRELQVRYANSTSSNSSNTDTQSNLPSVLSAGSNSSTAAAHNKLEKIRQLEAKLKSLEGDSEGKSSSRYKPY